MGAFNASPTQSRLSEMNSGSFISVLLIQAGLGWIQTYVHYRIGS